MTSAPLLGAPSHTDYPLPTLFPTFPILDAVKLLSFFRIGHNLIQKIGLGERYTGPRIRKVNRKEKGGYGSGKQLTGNNPQSNGEKICNYKLGIDKEKCNIHFD